MRELSNLQGEVCARLEIVPLGAHACALRHTWLEGVAGVPECAAWSAALGQLIEQCRARGVRRIEARIVVEPGGAHAADHAARTQAHRAVLQSVGFRPGESRVEYLAPLAEALAALESHPHVDQLTWRPVATEPGATLERAAAVLKASAEGDPDASSDDDALGFLLARREDPLIALAPESLLVGLLDGAEAAIVASSVRPSTGWCSLYYVGVLPAFRGRGFGLEAMRRGLRALASMGGRTYHDGTGSGNAPARSLFARIAPEPTRTLEQWRLDA